MLEALLIQRQENARLLEQLKKERLENYKAIVAKLNDTFLEQYSGKVIEIKASDYDYLKKTTNQKTIECQQIMINGMQLIGNSEYVKLKGTTFIRVECYTTHIDLRFKGSIDLLIAELAKRNITIKIIKE